MNTILNKIGEIRLTPARFFGFWIALFAIVISLTSCSDDLDVQQSYPFTVDVMPYGDKITQARPSSFASRSSPKETMPTPSIQSATSSMTAKALSNSLMVRCWSTTTVCFSKARPSV